MSFTMLPNAIFEYLRSQTITPTQALVYAIMIRYFNDQYGYAFPTVNQVAYEAGVSEQVARQAISKLVECGLLKKDRSPVGFRNNVYRVIEPLDSAEFNRRFPTGERRKRERW